MNCFILILSTFPMLEYKFEQVPSHDVEVFLSTKKRQHFCGTCEEDEKDMVYTSYDIFNAHDLHELHILLEKATTKTELTEQRVIKDTKYNYHLVFVHVSKL